MWRAYWRCIYENLCQVLPATSMVQELVGLTEVVKMSPLLMRGDQIII